MVVSHLQVYVSQIWVCFDRGHMEALLTVALFLLLAASRCALQGLHTSSSSSALLWFR